MGRSLQDLNAHLFEQLDRVSNSDLSGEDLQREIERSEAMAKISDQVLKGADVSLKAAKLFAEHGQTVLPHLPQIGKSEE